MNKTFAEQVEFETQKLSYENIVHDAIFNPIITQVADIEVKNVAMSVGFGYIVSKPVHAWMCKNKLKTYQDFVTLCYRLKHLKIDVSKQSLYNSIVSTWLEINEKKYEKLSGALSDKKKAWLSLARKARKLEIIDGGKHE